ncbi:dihydroorotase [Marinomonas colpomeniae]|uniref:Dihydroorotase n=1 Tax=Marinomonas colpomeniae TaxID=2774408 RepID=A0ABR8P0C6_9GAMM|nr:dihydroorotase [Marinomonas colpomeniae]MBD5771739.1 dihydroorotase [Marinomonas colpomeniae]
MNEITIIKPDDWHLHFRDQDMLLETVSATARCFARAVVMPNLVPPVTTAALALSYKERILAARPEGSSFTPIMTIYLTDKTSVQDIKDAKAAGVLAAKMYPAGATTNSDSGVNSLESLYPVFEALADNDMLLLIHGEVTQKHIDIFDREKEFIDQHMVKIVDRVPNLKIVFEHITTKDAADFVLSARDGVAATITPQHLLLNRNDMLDGGMRPHNYCLPVLKRSTHQAALRAVVKSGSPKFFLGTDSAPHTKDRKESDCGCAGCYSAWSALELYTQVFDELDALDKLEGFTSFHGADFYGLPRNTESVTLIRKSWEVPGNITLPNGELIVPFFAGKEVAWKLK